MSCDIEPVLPEGPVYRMARGPDAWAWVDWVYAGPDGSFGGRFDDPDGEYRVLYAAATRLGAFMETLAGFRTHPAVRQSVPATPRRFTQLVGRHRECMPGSPANGPQAPPRCPIGSSRSSTNDSVASMGKQHSQ